MNNNSNNKYIKYVNIFVPISIFLLLISDFLSIYGYEYIFFIVSFLTLTVIFFSILIIMVGTNFRIMKFSAKIFVVLVLYSIYILIFSRTSNYNTHIIISSIYLIVYFVILPNIISKKAVVYILLAIFLGTIPITLNVILKNLNTISSFANLGFDVKQLTVATYRNINYDASVVTYGFFSTYGLIKILSHKTIKRLIKCYLLIVVLALFVTYSRTAYLVVIVTVGIEFFYNTISKINNRLFKKGVSVLFLAGMLVFVLYLGFNLDSSTLSYRDLIWEQAFRYVSESPLIGHGLYFWSDNVTDYTSTHNSYLNILVEFGFLGLALSLSFLLYILIYINKRILFFVKKNKILIITMGFILGNLIGMFFETRRVGGINLLDTLPVIIISIGLTMSKN